MIDPLGNAIGQAGGLMITVGAATTAMDMLKGLPRTRTRKHRRKARRRRR